MAKSIEVPSRLYKYKKFDNQTLDLLITDRLYFADPTTFNDPLDSRPSVKADLNVEQLQAVLRRLVDQRSNAEMSAAARALKYKGPKTIDYIARQSRREAERLIDEIAYDAGNPAYEMDNAHSYLLVIYLARELLKRYEKGIVSLAGRSECPLMWSHYGDQHNGICIGYSVPTNRPLELHAVEYNGSRLVSASDVSKMLDGDRQAQDRVDQAVFLTKAAPWQYEVEWRLIGERGLQTSPLELEEIVFGVRCSPIVSFAVVKALEGRDRPIQFYRIQEANETFDLGKVDLDLDEEMDCWPRRSLSDVERFQRLESLDISQLPS